MSENKKDLSDNLCENYLSSIVEILTKINEEEKASIDFASKKISNQIKEDKLIYIFGPGGHSNLASQEVFFRAGGLMHFNAILDEGTLLSNGALRSMAIERTPGYGKIVIENQNLQAGDLLILVNAYGINSALIDAAITAREKGVFTIGISSFQHASETKLDHPARHPSKKNLYELVDINIDTKVPIGDAVIEVPGVSEKISAISTFANAFALNALVIKTITNLSMNGLDPPIWRSGNAPGGDEANARFIQKFKSRVKAL